MAEILTNKTFNSEVLESKGTCLVDFYADWCGPCKAMLPIIDSLAEKYDGKFGVYKVDVDSAGDVASKYSVSSIPCLLFFKDGELVETMVGATSQGKLEEKIELYL